VLLAQIAEAAPTTHVAIRTERLQPGAGDPLQLVVRAAQRIQEIERRRDKFEVKALLIDRGEAAINAAAIARANAAGIHVIWQTPDHEALLLRHLPNCQSLRPPQGISMGVLQRHWPEYQKAMPASRLAQRIGIDEILQASMAEPDLHRFLVLIGLLQV
jgi:hypothetical protein